MRLVMILLKAYEHLMRAAVESAQRAASKSYAEMQ